jgi:hypothetical protein
MPIQIAAQVWPSIHIDPSVMAAHHQQTAAAPKVPPIPSIARKW